MDQVEARCQEELEMEDEIVQVDQNKEGDDEEASKEVAGESSDMPSDDKLEDDVAEAVDEFEKEDEIVQEEQDKMEVVSEKSVEDLGVATAEGKPECEAEPVEEEEQEEKDEEEASKEVAKETVEAPSDDKLEDDVAEAVDEFEKE